MLFNEPEIVTYNFDKSPPLPFRLFNNFNCFKLFKSCVLVAVKQVPPVLIVIGELLFDFRCNPLCFHAISIAERVAFPLPSLVIIQFVSGFLPLLAA